MTPASFAILFSERNPSRTEGGEELVLRNILLGLSARGWRCLLAYHEWGDLVPEYEAAGIACRRFDLTPARPTNPGRFLASVAGQALWARRNGVGLLHCNSYFRVSHAAAVKHLGGFPAIGHLHNPPPDYLSRQYRWGLQQIDGLIAVSACTAAEWNRALARPSARVAVLHNGIDIDRFRPDEAARDSARRELGVGAAEVVIGYCGRLIREKGVDVLIRAVARLAAEHPALTLVILGSDAQNTRLYGEPLEAKLRMLAQELGIVGRFRFLGVRHDIERWHNAIDIVVVPSVYSDPLPLVVAEALACGRPVIGSRIGGIPELLSGPLAELLVPPGDDEALAAALQRLIADPQRRVRLGECGRQIVEKEFGVSLFLDQFESLIGMMASRCSRPAYSSSPLPLATAYKHWDPNR